MGNQVSRERTNLGTFEEAGESRPLSVYRHSFLSELPETVHQMTKRETKLRLFAKQPQSFLFLYIGTVCAWAQDNGSPVSVCYVMGQRPRLGVEDNLYNHFLFLDSNYFLC
jgi:hypothetical protein